MAFSGDSKFLVTQSGSSDWMLNFWSWEKGKILASVRTTNVPEKNNLLASKQENKESLAGLVVYQCLMSPTDSSLVSVVGNGIFKIYRFSEGVLKIAATPKIEQKV